MSHAHFHTPASGAGPNGSLLGAKAAFQTQTPQETTPKFILNMDLGTGSSCGLVQFTLLMKAIRASLCK